jgi:DNA-binding MarR family transcriptional regulator
LSSKIPLPEPDPFDAGEFAAWRGLLRLHETVMRELDRRLTEDHDLPLARYGVLITLVGTPDHRLRMGELADRRLLTPSGITRVVTKLEREGLVARDVDPQDGRSFYTRLTKKGLARLRQAQATHHAVVRERYLARLTDPERLTLAQLYEKALPGVISSPVWPPENVPTARTADDQAPPGSSPASISETSAPVAKG